MWLNAAARACAAGSAAWKYSRRLALDEQRPAGCTCRMASSASRLALRQVLERGDECRVGGQALVPPAVLAGKRGGDEDLVDRRVEAHPREAPREGARILGEQRAASPGSGNCPTQSGTPKWHRSAMGWILRRRSSAKVSSAKLPIVFARAAVSAIVRRAVAQVFQPQFAHQLEILPPALRSGRTSPSRPRAGRGRRGRHHGVAVLDPGGEEELVRAVVWRRRCPFGRCSCLWVRYRYGSQASPLSRFRINWQQFAFRRRRQNRITWQLRGMGCAGGREERLVLVLQH